MRRLPYFRVVVDPGAPQNRILDIPRTHVWCHADTPAGALAGAQAAAKEQVRVLRVERRVLLDQWQPIPIQNN
jgi:hypothetical protein